MTNRYKKLDLDDARPGMVLSEAILDDHGGILLPEETTLTDALLLSLRRRGVEEVWIVNDDVSEEELQAERIRVEKRTAVLFRNATADSAAESLSKHILDYRLGGKK